MLRATGIVFAALLGPILFVAGYLLLARAVHWHVPVVGDNVVVVGGVLAGLAPILLARGKLRARLLLAGLYAIPCAMAAGLYSLALNCSMFRECLS